MLDTAVGGSPGDALADASSGPIPRDHTPHMYVTLVTT
jgi:hypothetical protein